VGQITSRDETTYHAVEIEFADVNTGRPIRFTDYNGYTMAAMVYIFSSLASVLAADACSFRFPCAVNFN
jgi:hypothetical protein